MGSYDALKERPGTPVGTLKLVPVFNSFFDKCDPVKMAAIAGINKLARMVISGVQRPAVWKVIAVPAKNRHHRT